MSENSKSHAVLDCRFGVHIFSIRHYMIEGVCVCARVCTYVCVWGGSLTLKGGWRALEGEAAREARAANSKEAFFSVTFTSPRPMPSTLQLTVPLPAPPCVPLGEHYAMVALEPDIPPTPHPGRTPTTTAPH